MLNHEGNLCYNKEVSLHLALMNKIMKVIFMRWNVKFGMIIGYSSIITCFV